MGQFDRKLMVSHAVVNRGPETANYFMEDLASRVASRIQITTDGHKVYAKAVEGAFVADVDYAMLIKLYGNDSFDHRYSTGECMGTRTAVLAGSPDPKHVSTSFVERQNLTMRMSMRRFTRLTNAFNKKLDNYAAASALHFMHYNFGRYTRWKLDSRAMCGRSRKLVASEAYCEALSTRN